MNKMLVIIYSLILIASWPHRPVLAEGKEAPKNVIMMIGDGMGIGQIEITRQMEFGKDGRLFLESLPYTALLHTYSSDHAVTDSAAGGTAIATGEKTLNGQIGLTADGKETDSILDLFKRDGKKTGIISTNTVTDATPAAFTASVQNRWTAQEEIASQQLENKVDVILGGGKSYFSQRQDGRNLLKEATVKNYALAFNKQDLLAAQGNKLLGLFSEGYMSFKIDRPLLKSEEPSLLDMTKKALQLLENDNGFFLMVEGARIDHASHAGDITSVWKETIEFDETVEYAVNWAKQAKDTLVLVLADHETMGLSATEPMNIEGLKAIKASPQFIADELKKLNENRELTAERVKQTMLKYTGINLTETELQKITEGFNTVDGEVYRQFHTAWEIGSMIAKKYYVGLEENQIRAISSTGGHTGNPILLLAYGTGASSFHGVLDNTDVPKMIARLMNYQLISDETNGED